MYRAIDNHNYMCDTCAKGFSDSNFNRGHPTRFPGKYLLLNQLIPGWLAKLNKFKILAGKLKNIQKSMNLASWHLKAL